jgi:hypothetical protein
MGGEQLTISGGDCVEGGGRVGLFGEQRVVDYIAAFEP